MQAMEDRRLRHDDARGSRETWWTSGQGMHPPSKVGDMMTRMVEDKHDRCVDGLAGPSRTVCQLRKNTFSSFSFDLYVKTHSFTRSFTMHNRSARQHN